MDPAFRRWMSICWAWRMAGWGSKSANEELEPKPYAKHCWSCEDDTQTVCTGRSDNTTAERC